MSDQAKELLNSHY